MIEEPYRWVEAIANRREYIETQLASGSPIVAISYRDGVLFLTFSRSGQKIFEIYDRIAMGAIGHPGDIERLRMAAIELASTEGFTRSSADVSLRRLAHYSLSPVMKTAFEQVYGPPFLARLLFAEVGATPEEDLFLRVEYDGAIATNGAGSSASRHHFAAVSATKESVGLTESFLEKEHRAASSLSEAFAVGIDAWVIGSVTAGEDGGKKMPDRAAIAKHRNERLEQSGLEAAILERGGKNAIRYRVLSSDELHSLGKR
ncbi:MAG TPA: hypothetical protein VEI58_05920 [Chthoniobacterales bacterium]|nr:hypothetical protein [Chthoniobacterales bacterium]